MRMGYGGLIPFLVLALAIWFADPAYRIVSSLALLGYGVVIASFLGAMHWGMAMRNASSQSFALLGWGVAPGLLAWGALMMHPSIGLLLIAGVLWACFAVDRVMYPRSSVQAWLPMRLALTVVASASCVAGALGAM
jgi:Protein of unknown function (DUF3429)